jgi:hypothetical protein
MRLHWKPLSLIGVVIAALAACDQRAPLSPSELGSSRDSSAGPMSAQTDNSAGSLSAQTGNGVPNGKHTGVPVVVELGCLSTTNNYDNLVHGEFSADSPSYEINFEVCTIPADRANLLAYIKTYWNKSPTIVLTGPDGQMYTEPATEIDPNQSKVLYVNIPAKLGSYTLTLSGGGSKYTFFAAALMTSKSDFNAP